MIIGPFVGVGYKKIWPLNFIFIIRVNIDINLHMGGPRNFALPYTSLHLWNIVVSSLYSQIAHQLPTSPSKLSVGHCHLKRRAHATPPHAAPSPCHSHPIRIGSHVRLYLRIFHKVA